MDALEKKIGQMLLLGFRGLEVREDDPIARDIRELNLGGVILFDYDVSLGKPERNIASPRQVRALNDALQAMANERLLVAVDQEGGKVARLRPEHGFPPTTSAKDLGDADDPGRTRRCAEECAETLLKAGFNLNFAPDVDLAVNPENPIIAAKDRGYSADPDVVTRHAREVIEAHQSRGIACALKHFPGHGSSPADTHLGFVDVTNTWSEVEMEPFARLIGDGLCWSVMTAHVFNSRLDPAMPATLSKHVVTGLLRERFGFDGVVFSDDMDMGAISSRYGLEAAIFHAIDAGVDVLTFANNTIYQPDIGRRAVQFIAAMARDGLLSEERIDRSLARIQKLKSRLAKQ